MIHEPELLDLICTLGFVSSMIVPLVVREQVLGAISFVSAESGRHYNNFISHMPKSLPTLVRHSIPGSHAARTVPRVISMTPRAACEKHADYQLCCMSKYHLPIYSSGR